MLMMSSDPSRAISLVVAVTYVAASVLLLIGIRLRSATRSSWRGDAIGALGLLLAIGATLLRCVP